jgi:hypothetical protein
LLAEETIVPGMRGAMFAAVDSLRSSCARLEDVRCAEGISVGMHKLEWARHLRDENASAAAIDELRSLAASWLNLRIPVSADARLQIPC